MCQELFFSVDLKGPKFICLLRSLPTNLSQAVPMIDIPGYGTLAAEVVCGRMGIKNQHDAKKLAEAKAELYLKGFTSGVMVVGNHAGIKVPASMSQCEES